MKKSYQLLLLVAILIVGILIFNSLQHPPQISTPAAQEMGGSRDTTLPSPARQTHGELRATTMAAKAGVPPEAVRAQAKYLSVLKNLTSAESYQMKRTVDNGDGTLTVETTSSLLTEKGRLFRTEKQHIDTATGGARQGSYVELSNNEGTFFVPADSNVAFVYTDQNASSEDAFNALKMIPSAEGLPPELTAMFSQSSTVIANTNYDSVHVNFSSMLASLPRGANIPASMQLLIDPETGVYRGYGLFDDKGNVVTLTRYDDVNLTPSLHPSLFAIEKGRQIIAVRNRQEAEAARVASKLSPDT